MRLFELLLISGIHLTILGLDIVGFFVLMRFVSFRWPIKPVLAFDRVGRPLVDPLVTTVQRMVPPEWLGSEPSRTRRATAAALLAVTLCRLGLNGLVQLMVL